MTTAARTRPYRNDQRLIAGMLGLSAACHLFFGIALFVLPSFMPKAAPPVPFVTVDLMSAAPYAPPRQAAAPAGPPPRAEEPAPEPVPEPVVEEPPEIAPPPAPKPAEKVEVKPPEPAEKPREKTGAKAPEKTVEPKPAETAEPEEDLDAAKKRALAALSKKVEARSRPDSVAKAISDLRKKQSGPVGLTGGGPGSPGGISPNVPEGVSDSVALPKIMQFYVYDILNKHINAHWAFESSLAGRNKNLVARVLVTIMRNGTIADHFFEQRSGNAYFDDSVDKAIKKSNPAPPLPATYAGDRFQIGLIFIPPE